VSVRAQRASGEKSAMYLNNNFTASQAVIQIILSNIVLKTLR